MDAFPRISVVIPTYDRAKELSLTLRMLRANTFEDYEIIVVDDTPEEADCDIREICTRFAPISYVWRDLVEGDVRPVTSARKCGAAMALGDIVVWLDQDVLVRTDFLKLVDLVHTSVPNTVVLPWLASTSGGPGGFYEDLSDLTPSEVDHFIEVHPEVLPPNFHWCTSSKPLKTLNHFGTTGHSIARELFMRHDLWDARLPGWPLDDVDFSNTCVLASLPSVCCKDLKIFHMTHARPRYSEEMKAEASEYLKTKWGN